MSWTSGYISEIGYTYGYYRELNPGLMRLACINAGLAPPPARPLNYLELGYGQGVSINIHAAANPGNFWGTDFIPAQAAHAQTLAQASKSGAVLTDDSFIDFAARADLPEFDVIALHGTWSWVSDENRRTIVDIVRRRLRPGGILYMSYNCLPGWTVALPLRHLMALHVELAGTPDAGIIGKIDNAIAFTQSVVDSGAFHFRVNSPAVERLKAISGQERHYLAHEYFNRDWAVMPFSDVVRWLEDAKVSFAASAQLIDHIDAINLTPQWQQLLAGIANPVLRESTRDYLINHQFRRDIFIKGQRRLSPLERIEALRAQPFILLTRPEDIALKAGGCMGEVTLQEPIYRPLLELMAQGSYEPKTLGEIVDNKKMAGIPFEQVVVALLILSSIGHAHPTQPVTKQARERCVALNQYLCQRARSGSDISTLASPVIGGGVVVDRFAQLFLLAIQQGRKTIAEQAKFAWDTLSAQGHRLVKNGAPIPDAEQNLIELTQHATQFAEARLPPLRALGIA